MQKGRRIVIDLDSELSLFVKQERSRLFTQYGLRVSSSDIVKVLLVQHKIKVMHAAEEDDALLWYYQNLKDRERDISTEAAISSISNSRDRTKRKTN